MPKAANPQVTKVLRFSPQLAAQLDKRLAAEGLTFSDWGREMAVAYLEKPR